MIGGTARQNAVVGRRNVGMGADDEAGTAVEHPWPMAFFSLVASAWTSTTTASQAMPKRAGPDLPLESGERIVERVHEECAP